jgi:hypothetical protein
MAYAMTAPELGQARAQVQFFRLAPCRPWPSGSRHGSRDRLAEPPPAPVADALVSCATSLHCRRAPVFRPVSWPPEACQGLPSRRSVLQAPAEHRTCGPAGGIRIRGPEATPDWDWRMVAGSAVMEGFPPARPNAGGRRGRGFAESGHAAGDAPGAGHEWRRTADDHVPCAASALVPIAGPELTGCGPRGTLSSEMRGLQTGACRGSAGRDGRRSVSSLI